MNNRLLALAVVLMIVLSWPLAAAQGRLTDTFFKRIQLEPTPTGEMINARGRAAISINRHGIQSLRLQMVADVPDGTTYAVLVRRQDKWFLIGTLQIRASFGQFAVYSADEPLPLGVDPVTDIEAIGVADGDRTFILFGEF